MKQAFQKTIRDLSFWILVAMLAGLVVGGVMGQQAAIFAPFGALFMQLIKMLVVPLVLISIITGSAALGSTKSAGKIGFMSIAYMMITTAVAVVLALIAGNLYKTGDGLSVAQMNNLIPSGSFEITSQSLGFWNTLLGMIPANPFEALATGNILQIIIFGVFLGIGISMLAHERKQPLIDGMNTLLDALIWCMQKVMWIAPLGVFGLMADATGTYGYTILMKVANLLWLNVMLFAFMLLVFYPLTVHFFSKTNVKTFMKAMLKPQLVAFTTSSSLATLPTTLATCENDLKVSKETASFVVPLGATINMAGNAMYYAIVCLFFSQLYGIELGFGAYLAIIITSTLSAIGAAGVPGPTLMAIAVLVAAGLPIEGLPLLFAVDRVFDMLRTVLNITGDAACAVIVDSKKD